VAAVENIAVAHSAGSIYFYCGPLGLTPQALCSRLLRRLRLVDREVDIVAGFREFLVSAVIGFNFKAVGSLLQRLVHLK
jgi:hypothetical protein